jgi:hypothetical protein
MVNLTEGGSRYPPGIHKGIMKVAVGAPQLHAVRQARGEDTIVSRGWRLACYPQLTTNYSQTATQNNNSIKLT